MKSYLTTTAFPNGRLPRARTIAAALCFAFGGILGMPGAASAQKSFDHSAFDALLKAHVSNGLVDYGAFKKSSEFQTYLDKLAAFDPSSLARSEQLAFWINAYNAYTIKLINKHDETESIRNINKTLGLISAYGPWKEDLAKVGGKKYGLDEIEQGIVRPRYKEPRIHFVNRPGIPGD